MYIDNYGGKRPIAFKDIINAKVFECDGKFYIKAKYGDDFVAVDLQDGIVLNPTALKDSFETCYLYPGATLRVQGERRTDSNVDG